VSLGLLQGDANLTALIEYEEKLFEMIREKNG